jgi:hypothetical protein
MKRGPTDLELRRLRPDDVARYLSARGFERRSERHGKGWLYVKGNDSVIVPSRADARDYAPLLDSLICSLASASMTPDDVAAQIAFGMSDVVRHRVADLDTSLGRHLSTTCGAPSVA